MPVLWMFWPMWREDWNYHFLRSKRQIKSKVSAGGYGDSGFSF